MTPSPRSARPASRLVWFPASILTLSAAAWGVFLSGGLRHLGATPVAGSP